MLCVVGIGSVFGPIAAGYLGKAVGMVYSFYFLGGAVIAASTIKLVFLCVKPSTCVLGV